MKQNERLVSLYADFYNTGQLDIIHGSGRNTVVIKNNIFSRDYNFQCSIGNAPLTFDLEKMLLCNRQLKQYVLSKAAEFTFRLKALVHATSSLNCVISRVKSRGSIILYMCITIDCNRETNLCCGFLMSIQLNTSVLFSSSCYHSKNCCFQHFKNPNFQK